MTTKSQCNQICISCILAPVCPYKTHPTTHVQATDGKRRDTIRIVNHNQYHVDNGRVHSISRRTLVVR